MDKKVGEIKRKQDEEEMKDIKRKKQIEKKRVETEEAERIKEKGVIVKSTRQGLWGESSCIPSMT